MRTRLRRGGRFDPVGKPVQRHRAYVTRDVVPRLRDYADWTDVTSALPLRRREFHRRRRARHLRATPTAEGRGMTAHIRTSTPDRAILDRVRAPWLLYVDGAALTVRGARAQDLPGVALMHGRCSAKSLLDRYRTGGRAPAVMVLDRQLRDPMSFVVTTENGRVVALARVAVDGLHNFGSGELSVLVEDQWQRLGVGRALLRHCAAAAALAGYRQLITYPGTTAGAVQRLMARVGTTRLILDGQRHLHTALSEQARLGLGTLNDGGAAGRAVRALG
jgi:GNAT superfamily N-acetyltransferase